MRIGVRLGQTGDWPVILTAARCEENAPPGDAAVVLPQSGGERRVIPHRGRCKHPHPALHRPRPYAAGYHYPYLYG